MIALNLSFHNPNVPTKTQFTHGIHQIDDHVYLSCYTLTKPDAHAVSKVADYHRYIHEQTVTRRRTRNYSQYEYRKKYIGLYLAYRSLHSFFFSQYIYSPCA